MLSLKSITMISVAQILLLVTNGCGSAAAPDATASAVLMTAPSATLFSTYSALASQLDIGALRSVPTAKWYQDMLSAGTDATIHVPDLGLTFSGAHARLAAAGARFNDLSAAYPTLGDWFDATGVDPAQALDLGAFQNALRQASGTERSLALVDAYTVPLPNGCTYRYKALPNGENNISIRQGSKNIASSISTRDGSQVAVITIGPSAYRYQRHRSPGTIDSGIRNVSMDQINQLQDLQLSLLSAVEKGDTESVNDLMGQANILHGTNQIQQGIRGRDKLENMFNMPAADGCDQ